MSKGSPYKLENWVSWNPITGCDTEPISPGCANCWARGMAARFGRDFTPQFHPERLAQPSKWKTPRVVCTNFMGDMFSKGVKEEWIAKVFDTMQTHPQHQFLTLTKRIWDLRGFGGVATNIWMGASAENQEQLEWRGRMLNGIRFGGWNTWISIEPLLGPVEIPRSWQYLPRFIVIGCESGPKRRPCKLEWIRDIVKQCARFEIPCYVKQIPGVGAKSWGAGISKDPVEDEWPTDLRVRQLPGELKA